jgi:hypothetical protein
MRNEKQPVNFGHRPGLSQGTGELDKKMDDVHFDRFERGE